MLTNGSEAPAARHSSVLIKTVAKPLFRRPPFTPGKLVFALMFFISVYTTSAFLISPFFITVIFPAVADTTNPIAFVIWVIPATEECRVP